MATPFRQLESVTSYTADGVTTAWNFSFSSGYLDKAHVKAYQLSPLGARTDIPVTLGMFAGAYQLTISPAIQAGYELTIYRDTPTSVPLVDFTDAAALTEVALDTVVKQATFAAAETQDALSVASARIDQIGAFAQSASDNATLTLGYKNAAAQSATDANTYAGQALASKNAAAASALSVNDTNIVHIAGAETVTGAKTFSGAVVVNGALSGTGVTKTAVGLGNVDNTSDVNKPVSTATSTAIASAVAAVFGYKNRVRNGRMELSMRSGPFVTPGSGAYTLDGWRIYRAGGAVTVSQQTNPNTASEFAWVQRVVVTTANAAPAAGDHCVLSQPIEGYLVRDLVGNAVAIRFEVRSPKTGTHCVALRNAAVDRSYVLTYNVTTANAVQVVTLAIPGGLPTTGTWNFNSGMGVTIDFCLMATALYQGTAGSWQASNIFATAAQVNCLDTVGNTFEVTGVQLERAAAATPFEHRDIGVEAAIGYRYLQIMSVNAVASGFVQDYTCYQMRGSPTIIVVNNSWTGSPSFTGTAPTSFRQAAFASAPGNGTVLLSSEL